MRRAARQNFRAQRRMDVLTAALLFGLVFIRYCYYGLTYYAQLDDYIQYHNYTAFGANPIQKLVALGAFSARPLAGLCDVFVWARFYGHLIVAVALISVLYAVSAVLLHAVFRRRFGTGYVFYVVYALLPLGFEGSYWLSASSRIVVGLFFAALALETFDRWCTYGKRRNLIAFVLFQFISFCFYEQIVLFSAAATLVVMAAAPKGERGRAKSGWLFLVNGLLYFAVTHLAPGGVNDSRSALRLPWQENYTLFTAAPAWKQVKEVFVSGGAGIMGKGLRRALRLIGSGPNFAWLLLVAGLCFSFYIAARNERRKNVRFFAELLSGLFLAFAPLAVFFVLAAPWFGVRNALPSFCGLALLADALSDLLFGRWRGGAKAGAGFAAILAALCCIASVSELYDYRQTTQADTLICTSAAQASTDLKAPAGEKRVVWLLNVDASYVEDGNFYFHEHDYGVTSSDWATTGAVAAIANRKGFSENFRFVPQSAYRPFAAADRDIDKVTAFWFDGTSFSRVALTPGGGGRLVTNAAGQAIASLTRNADGALELKIK